MKNLPIQILAAFLLLLASCKGSDTYRGAWKALSANGSQYDILFDAKSFTIKDSEGKTEVFNYTQNSVSIENSVETYGINLSDGRKYKIHFPIAKDESVGLIKDANDNPLYTIGRTKFVQYDEIFKLK